jgi:hypothetical protein
MEWNVMGVEIETFRDEMLIGIREILRAADRIEGSTYVRSTVDFIGNELEF